MAWPRGEPSSHASKLLTLRSGGLLAVGIDVEGLAVPGHPLRLDLVAVRVAVAVAMDGDLRAHRDDPFLEPRVFGSRARRQRDVPHLAVLGSHFHCRVRTGQADAALYFAHQLEFLFAVPAPSVMRRRRKRADGECSRDHPERTSHAHMKPPLTMMPFRFDYVVCRCHRGVSALPGDRLTMKCLRSSWAQPHKQFECCKDDTQVVELAEPRYEIRDRCDG